MSASVSSLADSGFFFLLESAGPEVKLWCCHFTANGKVMQPGRSADKCWAEMPYKVRLITQTLESVKSCVAAAAFTRPNRGNCADVELRVSLCARAVVDLRGSCVGII